MKTCPLIDNVCIYGDSSRSFVVALVCPDRLNLDRLASKLGKQDTDFTSLVADKVNHYSFTFAASLWQGVVGAVLRELVQHGRNMKLEKFELPGAVSLVQVLRCDAPHSTAQRSTAAGGLDPRHRVGYRCLQTETEAAAALLPEGDKSNVWSLNKPIETFKKMSLQVFTYFT